MAYLTEIYEPKCVKCRSKATKTLMTWRNEKMADYCARHAPEALRLAKEAEARQT